jgi:hypothetical protein
MGCCRIAAFRAEGTISEAAKNGGGLVPWSRMQDCKGRRRSAIAGLVVGVLASMGCTGSGGPSGAEDESTTGSLGSSTGGPSSSGGEPGPPVPLVKAEAWELDAADDDPFADHRPMYVQCEIGWDVETGLLEINTDLCLYGAFVQPSLVPIHAGDELELVLLYDALYSTEGETVAHVAVALGSEIAWETELPIPSEAGQARPTWTATADLQVGSPIHLHLHNHGTNNYRLVALTVAER